MNCPEIKKCSVRLGWNALVEVDGTFCKCSINFCFFLFCNANHDIWIHFSMFYFNSIMIYHWSEPMAPQCTFQHNEQLSHKINTAPFFFFSASLKYSQYPEVINTEFTKMFSLHLQNTKTTRNRFVSYSFFLSLFSLIFLFHKFQTCTYKHLQFLHTFYIDVFFLIYIRFSFKLNSRLESNLLVNWSQSNQRKTHTEVSFSLSCREGFLQVRGSFSGMGWSLGFCFIVSCQDPFRVDVCAHEKTDTMP